MPNVVFVQFHGPISTVVDPWELPKNAPHPLREGAAEMLTKIRHKGVAPQVLMTGHGSVFSTLRQGAEVIGGWFWKDMWLEAIARHCVTHVRLSLHDAEMFNREHVPCDHPWNRPISARSWEHCMKNAMLRLSYNRWGWGRSIPWEQTTVIGSTVSRLEAPHRWGCRIGLFAVEGTPEEDIEAFRAFDATRSRLLRSTDEVFDFSQERRRASA